MTLAILRLLKMRLSITALSKKKTLSISVLNTRLRIRAPSIMTLSIRTLSKIRFSITRLSIKTPNYITLSIRMTNSIAAFSLK